MVFWTRHSHPLDCIVTLNVKSSLVEDEISYRFRN